MQIVKTSDKNFDAKFRKVTTRHETLGKGVEETVNKIIKEVRRKKDAALVSFTRKFDLFNIHPKKIAVTPAEIEAAYDQANPKALKALQLAAKRIHEFHSKIHLKSWEHTEKGISLGQQVRPLERVGIYVPGGKASYPSSVLMNAIPASVAGVEEIYMVTPFPRGEVNPYVLIAAELAGVEKIYKVGGAQAVAALAYGTETIPQVDKIVGPGNIYVATAKRQVFGQVAIDMIAGPSEITVVGDGNTPADWVAADLLSQAEHDEQASAILICWDESYALEVKKSLQTLLEILPRGAIAKKSIQNHGAIFIARNENEAIDLANRIAPEHLELSVQHPRKLLSKIKNAGAIFLGSYTTEAFGDYLAGPNHVLPTNGTARFASPLSTLDFLKLSSVIECNKAAVKELGYDVALLAELEGLEAHALSMKLRLNT